ncbi:MAG: 6-phosphofructokinase [Rubrivivax sp.]
MLQAHGIGHFFYIGGNDCPTPFASSAKKRPRRVTPLRCIHIPKTIDNDLVSNDHTPGFPRRRGRGPAFAGAGTRQRGAARCSTRPS